MKSILFVCFFFSMSCYGVFVPMATAASWDRSGHTPADEMLEFSLLRLKESVRKTTQKNERLSFENDMLRKGIGDLQRVKENLAKKKAELSGRPGTYRSNREFQFAEVVDMDGRKRRTQELIAIFQKDIRNSEEKVRVLEDRLNEGGFNSRKKMLSERKERVGKDLIVAEKRLEALKKKNLGPLNQIEELTRVQTNLVREIDGLQYRLNRF